MDEEMKEALAQRRAESVQRPSKRSEDGRIPLLQRGDPVVKAPKRGNPRAAILDAKYTKALAERRRNNAQMVVVQQVEPTRPNGTEGNDS
jgi:hypothetical protein